MKKNIGIVNEVVRIIVGLFLLNIITECVALLTVAISTVLLLIATVNICRLYSIFWIKPCKIISVKT